MGIFGDNLREAREDLGVTLLDAERETRIHRRYLEALENEDEAVLPPAVYTRGFIRTYCQYLGLNPDGMLDLFGPREAVERRADLRPIPAQFSTPRSISLRPVAALGILVMVVLLLAYLWAQYNSFVESLNLAEQASIARTAVPVVAAAKPSPSPSPILAASPGPVELASTPTPPPTPARGLVVEARILERTWMEVWTDERQVLAETIQPGTSRTFQAEHQVKMRVGNAAGVHVIVNGTSQGQLGARGQAVEASWGRQ
jgi:cytoskeleton protein RodZ